MTQSRTSEEADRDHLPDKGQWRARLRERRRQVDASQAQQAAASSAEHLISSVFWEAQHIGLYLPNDGELDPVAISQAARAAGKQLYLPALDADVMEFREWTPGLALTPNRYGIGEPAGKAVPAETLDLLIMPLVGWSGAGFRLGMGGGYYDRYLAGREHSKPLRLGLGYECQRDDRLQTLQDSWDIALDALVSDRGLYRLSSRSFSSCASGGGPSRS